MLTEGIDVSTSVPSVSLEPRPSAVSAVKTVIGECDVVHESRQNNEFCELFQTFFALLLVFESFRYSIFSALHIRAIPRSLLNRKRAFSRENRDLSYLMSCLAPTAKASFLEEEEYEQEHKFDIQPRRG